MSYENSAGIGVSNQYGPRDTGVSVGTDHSYGSEHELTIELTAKEMGGGFFLPPFVVPKGARFVRGTLSVHSPISVTASVNVGGAVPGTNGVVLTQAQLASAANTAIDVSAALAGTWATASATGTTAAEKVTYSGGGTITRNNGKATLTLKYIYKQRV